MSDDELRKFGKAARYMVSPTANMGKPPLPDFVLQLEEARAEWRRRCKGPGLSSAWDAACATGERVEVAGHAVAAVDWPKDFTATDSSSLISKTVYSLVICIRSVTLSVRLRSFSSLPASARW